MGASELNGSRGFGLPLLGTCTRTFSMHVVVEAGWDTLDDIAIRAKAPAGPKACIMLLSPLC